jgi:hypothetical protein
VGIACLDTFEFAVDLGPNSSGSAGDGIASATITWCGSDARTVTVVEANSIKQFAFVPDPENPAVQRSTSVPSRRGVSCVVRLSSEPEAREKPRYWSFTFLGPGAGGEPSAATVEFEATPTSELPVGGMPTVTAVRDGEGPALATYRQP